MANEMVERVARAIARHRANEVGHWTDENVARYIETTWWAHSREARYAIEAMREPTEAMEEAGEKDAEYNPSAAKVWADMIDAALKED